MGLRRLRIGLLRLRMVGSRSGWQVMASDVYTVDVAHNSDEDNRWIFSGLVGLHDLGEELVRWMRRSAMSCKSSFETPLPASHKMSLAEIANQQATAHCKVVCDSHRSFASTHFLISSHLVIV